MNVGDIPVVLPLQNLPKNAVMPVYLLDKAVRLSNKKTKKKYQSCCVSFLQNLVGEPNLTLSDLIKGRKIGALHIQNHEVISLTVTPEAKESIDKANITAVSIFQGQNLIPAGEVMIRIFVSEEQYRKYAAKLG